MKKTECKMNVGLVTDEDETKVVTEIIMPIRKINSGLEMKMWRKIYQETIERTVGEDYQMISSEEELAASFRAEGKEVGEFFQNFKKITDKLRRRFG